MSGIKEDWTVKEINRVLKARKPNVWYYRPVPSRWGARLFDYIGIAYGYGFAIEAKKPGEEPTELQWQRLGEVSVARGATFAIDGLQQLRNFMLWLDWCSEHPLDHLNWPQARR